MLFRYSRWDGTQRVDFDAEDLLDAMADDVLYDGDPWRAMRRLMQQGMQTPEGGKMPGLRDLLERLKRQRQQRLDRYDLGSSLDDIKKKLDQIVKQEREGIKQRMPEGRDRTRHEQKLDELPPDPAGKIRNLQKYDFVDPEAKRQFEELMNSLRQQMLQPFMQGMKQALGNMSPQDMKRLREMLQDLNRMLAQRANGEEPDFEAFKQKWGDRFPGVESLDQLIEQIGRQMAAMQSLMQSLTPEQRQQLDEMMRELMMRDERLEAAMRQLGMQSREDLDRLRELSKRLEEAGYLERDGDELKLTARAIRKIGDKALRDIFTRLKRDRFGGHTMNRRGAGGDQLDETKAYEFGDPFLLDLRQTLMNAVERQGPGTPVRVHPADFEVHRTELRTQAATVVMLDMSRSMLNNGYFLPAKKVVLALSSLIRGQFPRDALYIVGFSLYAREFKAAQLPTLSWSEWNVGTDMHAGFMLARELLNRHHGGNKQIIMVTDGEPTAHLEDGVADFSYPPTRRTVEETLKEVQRCTRDGIVINTFMLERTPWLASFVEQMARINRGRAFFSAADKLGEYVVVDYVSTRRRSVR